MKINNISPLFFINTRKNEDIHTITVFDEKTGNLTDIKIGKKKRDSFVPNSEFVRLPPFTPKNNSPQPVFRTESLVYGSDQKEGMGNETLETTKKKPEMCIETSSTGTTDTTDTTIEHNEIEKKKEFKKKSVNYNFHDLKNYCEYWRALHNFSGKHYEKRNKYFVVPSIVITSVGGLLSFFASSNAITNEDRINLTLSVGCISTLAGIIQALSNSLALSKKAESHQSAMESFDLLLNKIRFHILKGNHTDDDDINFLNQIENEIMEIKKRCKYSIPDKIQKMIIDKNYERIKNTKIFEVKKEIIEDEIDNLRDTLKQCVRDDIENQLNKV